MNKLNQADHFFALACASKTGSRRTQVGRYRHFAHKALRYDSEAVWMMTSKQRRAG